MQVFYYRPMIRCSVIICQCEALEVVLCLFGRWGRRTGEVLMTSLIENDLILLSINDASFLDKYSMKRYQIINWYSKMMSLINGVMNPWLATVLPQLLQHSLLPFYCPHGSKRCLYVLVDRSAFLSLSSWLYIKRTLMSVKCPLVSPLFVTFWGYYCVFRRLWTVAFLCDFFGFQAETLDQFLIFLIHAHRCSRMFSPRQR